MNQIDFNYIKSYFSSDKWDVGYLDEEKLKRCSYSPIKEPTHSYGYDYSNLVHFDPKNRPLVNALVLIRKTYSWDYTFYEEADSILKNSDIKNWFPIYTNFKEAAILSGLGVRARNSLIYSYKFGFECKISSIGFFDKITNFPLNKRVNYKLWKRCSNCFDCVINCPAQAIRGEKEPFWIDSEACDNFIGLSDHSSIPSVKKFWYANVYPELPEDKVKNLKTMSDVVNTFNGPLPFDKNGYSFDGFVVKKDNKTVQVPICRECISQPRCSKWGGNFPYNKIEELDK